MEDSIKPRRYLITIGVPSCPAMKPDGCEKLDDLENVESDVEKVVKLFRSQDYIHAIPEKIQSYSIARDIQSNIEDWFREEDRKSSDHVVIYYTGHAGKIKNLPHYYLFTLDSNIEQSRSRIDIKNLVTSCIGNSKNSPKNILLILDACYAGCGGNEILNLFASWDNSRPEGGFRTICAAGSHDEAIDGSFAEALKNVLSPQSPKLSEDEFISLDQLVEEINRYIESRYKNSSTNDEKEHWKQRCQLSTPYSITQARFIDNPHFCKNPIAEQTLNQSVARALQTIDFKVQQDLFNDFLESDRLSEVFFLEVPNDNSGELQKCLVSRLGGLLTGGNSPTFKMTQVQRRWQRETTSQLCEWLVGEFKLSPGTSLDNVHDQLIQLCQTQSVFIVLYGAPLMKDSGIATMLEEFWSELQKKLPKGHSTVCQGKLILLLAGSTPMPRKLLPRYQNSNGQEYDHYLELDVILKPDIHEWSRLPQIKPLINQLRGPNYNLAQLYQDELSKTPGANACDAMQIVCEVLGFPDGLTDFQEYWTLSGDLVR
jgi:hypothetical protein